MASSLELEPIATETDAFASLSASINEAATRISNALDEPYDQSDSIQDVGHAILNRLLALDPAQAAALANEKMLIFQRGKDVLPWARLYVEAQLRIVKELATAHKQHPISLFRQIVRHLDLALFKASGLRRESLIREALLIMDGFEDDGAEEEDESDVSEYSEEDLREFMGPNPLPMPLKKPRFDVTVLKELGSENFPKGFPKSKYIPPKITHPPFTIRREDNQRPSHFQFQHMLHIHIQPILIWNAIDDWPAINKWKSPKYWFEQTHGGQRMIPVELGRMYTDEEWDQRLMPFAEFLQEYMINNDPDTETAACFEEKGRSKVGYYAQHEFLKVMPNFYKDIKTPDYCYANPSDDGYYDTKTQPLAHIGHGQKHLGSSSPPHEEEGETKSAPTASTGCNEPDLKIQLWLGPANTISPAHIDSFHNVFCQVVGFKYFRLYPPSQRDKLCPQEGRSNTAGADVGLEVEWWGEEMSRGWDRERLRQAQREEYPGLENAEYKECIVGPGDALFIPQGWWHYVQSLTPSASVSFWWATEDCQVYKI